MAEKTAEQKKNDWALKVLAVVFAVILWFYADAEQNPMTGRQFDVPVQYINQAEDYVEADGVSTVRVTIRGKEADFTSLRSDDFTATVDLTNAVAGSGEYDITVEAPSVTEKFSYLPVKTMLTIDQMQTKDVSVRVRTTGSLPSGYELSSTDVVPELVTVAGLSKDLDAISDIDNISSSRHVSIATGVAAYPLLREIADMCEQRCTGLKCDVFAIKNDFFGEKITVAGLITATDIYNQLKNENLGDTLFIPSSMLRAEGDMFLDSITVNELSDKLGVNIVPINNDGYALVNAITNS